MRQPAVRLHLLKVGSCRHIERVAMRGAPLRAIAFPALAALIIHPSRGPILFDTGYARHFHEATEAFPERIYRWLTPVVQPAHQQLARQLARFGAAPADVRLCIVSHYHGDHVAGLRDLPNASILVMRQAHEDLRKRGRIGALIHGLLPRMLPGDLDTRVRFAEACPAAPLPAPWDALGSGYDLLGDASLLGVELPGHAAGHMGLLLRDADDRTVLLAADAGWSIHGIREWRMPSSIVRPIIDDWGAYKSTLGRLHRLCVLNPELVILPSHCGLSLAAYQPLWSQQ